MKIAHWIIDENDPAYKSRLERAKSATLTPLGFRKDVGFAVFSGKSGVYNTTIENCTCYDFTRQAPCKHILRLAMEMGLLDEQFESDMSEVQFSQEPTVVTKKVFVDASTGEVFDERPLPEGPLSNTTVVLTGIFSRSREEVASMVNAAGGKVASSISRKTGLLVVGDEPGSRLTKAQELGIKTISEKDLFDLIEKG